MQDDDHVDDDGCCLLHSKTCSLSSTHICYKTDAVFDKLVTNVLITESNKVRGVSDGGAGQQERADPCRALLVPKHEAADQVSHNCPIDVIAIVIIVNMIIILHLLAGL